MSGPSMRTELLTLVSESFASRSSAACLASAFSASVSFAFVVVDNGCDALHPSR